MNKEIKELRRIQKQQEKELKKKRKEANKKRNKETIVETKENTKPQVKTKSIPKKTKIRIPRLKTYHVIKIWKTIFNIIVFGMIFYITKQLIEQVTTEINSINNTGITKNEIITNALNHVNDHTIILIFGSIIIFFLIKKEIRFLRVV